MLTSTVTQKGQVTIPKKIRNDLCLATNDKVIFVRRGDSVIIKPVRNLSSLRGIVKAKDTPDFTSIRKKVRAEISKRIADE